MIIETQAQDIPGKDADCATKIEILCSICNRDVDETELAALKCDDCGADLNDPTQHITIAVTSVPVFAIVF